MPKITTKLKYVFVLLCMAFAFQVHAQENEIVQDPAVLAYIKQYKQLAIDEQIRAGVPAAITLAQGIHESASGQSKLAVEANNHFGIKCKKDWTGQTILHDDDLKSECFRKYESAYDSYIDHSDFLKKNPRYAALFRLDINDYQAWSKGLRIAGYATNPQYATRLINLIETYNLNSYTTLALQTKVEEKADKVIAKVEPVKKEIATIKKEEEKKISTSTQNEHIPQNQLSKASNHNGIEGVWVKKGEHLLSYALEHNIRLVKLLSFNDLEDDLVPHDMFVYFKRKNKSGSRKYRIVAEGETMHIIAQDEAIQLNYLYAFNNLYLGEEPLAGEKIYLQEKSPSTPKLINTKRAELSKNEETNTPIIEHAKQELIFTKKDKEVIYKEEIVPESTVEIVPVKEEPQIVEIKEEPKAVEIVKETIKETVKENSIPEIKKVEEIKKQEPAAVLNTTKKEEPKSEVISKNSKDVILDKMKAMRTEKLLNDGYREVDSIVKQSESQVQAEQVIVNNNTQKEEVKTIDPDIKTKAEAKKEKTYDEQNVKQDVKDLKKKFDAIIYKD